MRRIKDVIKKLFPFKKCYPSLNIVGVGPGDPSCITIAAINALKKSKVIFYPISGADKTSFAAEIVRKYIKNKKQIPIVFPMSIKGIDPDQIWKDEADKIIKYLNNNYSVALICLGDTSIYASSSHILSQIKKTNLHIKINTIPGISSISLAAALCDFQLISHGEKLEVFECPSDLSSLSDLIKNGNKRVLAIMKVGKRWPGVKKILQKSNIYEEALLAVNIGMKNQFVGNASDYSLKVLPYFSIILLRL